jgi:protein-disulfide isomerase
MRRLFVTLAFSLVAFAATAADESSEPNLRVAKDSGGKATSSIITDAPISGDYVMGGKDAPLVIVEYASLSCPHCAHFSNAVLPEIDKRYIETGKVRYVLRQFPLNEPALKAAMLVECVGEQSNEKYFLFNKVLFDSQNKWAFDGNYMAGLETIANVGGLSKEQFQNCLSNTDREVKVLKVKKLAKDELKIPHTPYIFIGDEVYTGDLSIESVGAFIDDRLAKMSK